MRATLKTCSLLVAVIAATIGIATLASAVAQQAQTAGIVTFDLFVDDGFDFNPDEARKLLDAARRAQAPGACPLGRITIIAPEGDPQFQQALGYARRDKVLQFLDLNGVDPSRFFADAIVFGGSGPGNDAQLDFDAGRDHEPPKLDVTWTPEKGTRVAAGTRITATAMASDDTSTFQSGVESIDLTIQGGGFFGFHSYPPPPSPCERTTPSRTLDGVYTVPANPPSLVRLHAIAKDFAGNEINLWAEYPTQDAGPCSNGAWWVGSIRGIHHPYRQHEIQRTAESVRLCEGPIEPSLEYVNFMKGQTFYITLFDAGSTITYVHRDVSGDCRISGQGTSPMNKTVGVIASVLEDVGVNGELRWSAPTYWLSASLAGEYTYTEVCRHDTLGPQTNTYAAGGGGWPINIGNDSNDPQNGSRKLESTRMTGSYATPDGMVTASWSLTRQGGAALFPSRAPSAR